MAQRLAGTHAKDLQSLQRANVADLTSVVDIVGGHAEDPKDCRHLLVRKWALEPFLVQRVHSVFNSPGHVVEGSQVSVPRSVVTGDLSPIHSFKFLSVLGRRTSIQGFRTVPGIQCGSLPQRHVTNDLPNRVPLGTGLPDRLCCGQSLDRDGKGRLPRCLRERVLQMVQQHGFGRQWCHKTFHLLPDASVLCEIIRIEDTVQDRIVPAWRRAYGTDAMRARTPRGKTSTAVCNGGLPSRASKHPGRSKKPIQGSPSPVT